MKIEKCYPALMEAAKADPHYQTCLEKVAQLEPLYLSLRDSLPELQKRTLEYYISACEELDYALLLLAMRLQDPSNPSF